MVAKKKGQKGFVEEPSQFPANTYVRTPDNLLENGTTSIWNIK